MQMKTYDALGATYIRCNDPTSESLRNGNGLAEGVEWEGGRNMMAAAIWTLLYLISAAEAQWDADNDIGKACDTILSHKLCNFDV